LGFGAGEGIRILDPLNLCFMESQNLENYIDYALTILLVLFIRTICIGF